MAGRNKTLGEIFTPEPGEAVGLLFGGQAVPIGLRVHAERQPRESPFQK